MFSSDNTTKMKITYISPKRVVTSENVIGESSLFINQPTHPSFTKKDVCIIKKGGYILIDFGCEIAGGVEFITQYDLKIPSSKLHITFGESVSEAMSTLGDKNSGNYHSVRDTVIDVVPFSKFNFGSTGFRFVKLEAVDTDIGIRKIVAKMETKDIEVRGSFNCSDELLNKIWDTSVYTVYLNMNEYIYDGIKRDRLVWIGDMYPEYKTIISSFGYDDSIRNSLELAKNEWSDTLWMNKIPSYTFWWIKIQRDLYYYSGDIEYLRRQEAFIEKVLDKLKLYISEDGELTFEKLFTDWSTEGTEDIHFSFRACLLMGLNAIEDILSILENGKTSECKRLKEYVLKFIPECHGSKQAAAMGVFSGICDAKKVNDDVLTKNPLTGLSTFYGYFVLIAKAMADDINGAMEIMKGYWGKMLELGSTTFWEEFDLDWAKNASPITELVPSDKDDIHGDFGKFCYVGRRLSLCHGWASGPAAFMSEYILGVSITEPGCKKISVKPHLGNLTYAKGTFPTPYGEVYVSHKVVNGEIVSEISAPDEIEIIK